MNAFDAIFQRSSEYIVVAVIPATHAAKAEHFVRTVDGYNLVKYIVAAMISEKAYLYSIIKEVLMSVI